MCSPIAVAGGAAGVGTLLQMRSQYLSGLANEQIAKHNAQLAEYQRSDALRRGSEESSAILQAGRRAGASARVATAANGVDTGGLAESLSAMNSATDAARAKANAARAAWGYAAEAQDFRTQARLHRQGGILGALGTGLSGVGQAGMLYSSGS